MDKILSAFLSDNLFRVAFQSQGFSFDCMNMNYTHFGRPLVQCRKRKEHRETLFAPSCVGFHTKLESEELSKRCTNKSAAPTSKRAEQQQEIMMTINQSCINRQVRFVLSLEERQGRPRYRLVKGTNARAYRRGARSKELFLHT